VGWRSWTVAGVIAVAVVPVAGASAAWSPVTGPTTIIQQIGKVRSPDGTLHVVWTRRSPGGGNTDDVVHVSISAAGVVGTPVPIASGFSGASNPAIVTTPGGGLRVFFGAIQCTNQDCPLGLFSATSSDGGSTWSAPTALFDRDQAYASDVNAATLADGTPFETWWHTTGTTVHRGLDPATPDYDYQASIGAGCCGYYSNLAADQAGGLQLAWDSNATGFPGVWSRAVDPSSGAPAGSAQLMPGSVTEFGGTPSHSQMLSRTPIVSVPGAAGTYYVAYPGGYPSTTKLLLWRVGSAASETVADEPDGVGHVSLAADGQGRVWVFWSSRTTGGPHVLARRVRPQGSGPAVDLGAPAGAQSIYALDGAVGPGGEPEVLALAGQADGTAGTYLGRGRGLAPPVLGKAVDVALVSGKVFVKVPGGRRARAAAGSKGRGFVPLSEARQLPVGTQIDARRGTLQLTAAAGQGPRTQRVTLSGALFAPSQLRKGKRAGLTTLKLLEGAFPGAPSYARCRGTRASAARVNRKALQALRARDKHGHFRTRGRYSAATTRGTIWDTIDRCDGTLTVVRRGAVRVTDFARRRTITLRAGKRYLARAR
jgi:hypothetical protein